MSSNSISALRLPPPPFPKLFPRYEKSRSTMQHPPSPMKRMLPTYHKTRSQHEAFLHLLDLDTLYNGNANTQL